jgi:hypothetical protein
MPEGDGSAAVLAAEEMVREACRRGEKVVVPLPPPHLSTAQLHITFSPPSWFAWQVEERLLAGV